MADHETVYVQFGDMEADIDVGIAPLIEEVWRAGIMTGLSCQEIRPGKARIVFLTAEDAETFLNIVVGEYSHDYDSLYNRIRQAWSTGDEDKDSWWDFATGADDESIEDDDLPDGSGEEWSIGPPQFKFSISIRFPVTDIPVLLERMKVHNETAATRELESSTEQVDRHSEGERRQLPALPESYKVPRPNSDTFNPFGVLKVMEEYVDWCRGEEEFRRTVEVATPGQRALHACHTYVVMTLADDHSMYLRSYVMGYEDALQGFEMLGAPKHQEILAQALSVFPNSKPPTTVREREFRLRDADYDFLKVLEHRLREIEDEFDELAMQYVLAHPEEFFVDP
jgi:hypothetical protein